MADIVTPEVRSRMMAAIGRRDTKPEIAVRKALHAAGFRFRVDVRKLPGAPDLALSKWRTAIFVHGCFWHRHGGCPKASVPATRPDFWAGKFASNVARDQRVQAALIEAGWKVVVIWECSISTSNMEASLLSLMNFIREGEPSTMIEIPQAATSNTVQAT
ncbi:very short patch repair endonuclease [Paracoccus hibiscisoli]|uniref:Very short patch repair endonuclease n=1 Tax=Paracoccus hibiscisoli TaxID=2023261 RepID=A0A4U0QSK1_9RHOB|nr:very short patch repair endonuclease [Paracoccus hibiscisoli]TJZ84866.1 DNA mismatch endonuclease Vsr [Paracoccus hibiscisoli]